MLGVLLLTPWETLNRSVSAEVQPNCVFFTWTLFSAGSQDKMGWGWGSVKGGYKSFFDSWVSPSDCESGRESFLFDRHSQTSSGRKPAEAGKPLGSDMRRWLLKTLSGSLSGQELVNTLTLAVLSAVVFSAVKVFGYYTISNQVASAMFSWNIWN